MSRYEVSHDAAIFAHAAHAAVGQTRKYTGEPYYVHCANVAALVNQHLGCEDFDDMDASCVVAAAYLHDVLEDTSVTEHTLHSLFGRLVADLVLEVTDVSRPEDGNRAKRKAIDRDHIAKASRYGKAIKLADLIDNTRSIVKHDPHFAKVYLKEKEELIKGPLKGSASNTLYELAVETLNEAKQALGM